MTYKEDRELSEEQQEFVEYAVRDMERNKETYEKLAEE